MGKQRIPQMSDFCCMPQLQVGYKRCARCLAGLFTGVRGETVWKIRMSFALRSRESEKGGEKHPYRRLALPKTRNPHSSSYFPNSFGR
jgi:hypothetical protein